MTDWYREPSISLLGGVHIGAMALLDIWLIWFGYIALLSQTVIRFLWASSKFGPCTVVSVYGTLVENKMCWFKGVCAHFSFSKCHIYTTVQVRILSLTHTQRITVQWGGRVVFFVHCSSDFYLPSQGGRSAPCGIYLLVEDQSLACNIDEEDWADRSSQHFIFTDLWMLEGMMIDRCNNGTVTRDTASIYTVAVRHEREISNAGS